MDNCAALAVQPDDRLVVVGSRRTADDEQAFAARLLPSGAPDPGFSDAAVSGAMVRATALAVDNRGAIAVAGHDKTGLSGALVVRLQADGLLDSLFGDAGSTFLELPGDGDVWLDVGDMQANPDGSLLLGGGERSNYRPRPFLVRLLGEAAGGGPGVLDMQAAETQANEAGQQAVMHVRRIGGSTGAVSVAYQTHPDTDRIAGATPGQDYTAVSGRLQWADGDSSDKSILVPLATGEAVKEGEEFFSVQISDPQGGAGLGTHPDPGRHPRGRLPGGPAHNRAVQFHCQRRGHGAGGCRYAATLRTGRSLGDRAHRRWHGNPGCGLRRSLLHVVLG